MIVQASRTRSVRSAPNAALPCDFRSADRDAVASPKLLEAAIYRIKKTAFALSAHAGATRPPSCKPRPRVAAIVTTAGAPRSMPGSRKRDMIEWFDTIG